MIIGDLDLDRAQRDPAYLARVKAFLVPGDQGNARLYPASTASPAPKTGTALVSAADDILQRQGGVSEVLQGCHSLS